MKTLVNDKTPPPQKKKKKKKKKKYILKLVENTLGKGENAGYMHFLLFLKYFQKLPS